MWRRVSAYVLTVIILASLLWVTVSFASDDAEPFQVSLEFYETDTLPLEGALPGDAQPLDPLQLPEGQDITVAIRYSGLAQTAGLKNDGIQCLALSLRYDADCFHLDGFGDDDLSDDGTAALWQLFAESDSQAWIPSALADGYSASASVRKITTTEERDIRKIYIQYIAEEDRSSTKVLNDVNEGYLGAFTFQVRKAISAEEGVEFEWDDLAVSFYETNLAKTFTVRLQDAGTTDHFDAPADVPVATSSTAEPEGVTVSGVVSSYNPRSTATIALYPLNGETDIAALTRDGRTLKDTPYKTTIGDPNAGTTNSLVTETFLIENVPKGTYVLVVKKAGHLIYTIKGIQVDEQELDLSKFDDAKVKNIQLKVGDVNDDGSIDGRDSGLLFSKASWTKKVANGANPLADLTGDGTVDGQDSGKMFSKASWMAKDTGVYLVTVDLT